MGGSPSQRSGAVADSFVGDHGRISSLVACKAALVEVRCITGSSSVSSGASALKDVVAHPDVGLVPELREAVGVVASTKIRPLQECDPWASDAGIIATGCK